MFNSLTIVIKIIGDTIKHIVIKDIVVSWSNMFTLKVMKFKIKLIVEQITQCFLRCNIK